jgi:hypothetical protein
MAALGSILLVSAAVGFGVSREDRSSLREFAAAVGRWQRDPDFRAVQREYVERGTRAMQARWCGLSARTVVMGFRSLPGLPRSLAATDASDAHYQAFARGPLSAYLHLSGEQNMGDGVPMIAALARQSAVTDSDVVAFLSSFKLPVPTVTDAGAVAGVRAMLRDIGRTPLMTAPLATLLTPRIEELARRQGAPAEVGKMTPRQQQRVLAQLDGWLRARDPEAWATKQASDLLSGIWAQGYGTYYARGIHWLLRIQAVAKVVFVLACGAMIMLLRRAFYRAGAKAAASSSALSAGDISN